MSWEEVRRQRVRSCSTWRSPSTATWSPSWWSWARPSRRGWPGSSSRGCTDTSPREDDITAAPAAPGWTTARCSPGCSSRGSGGQRDTRSCRAICDERRWEALKVLNQIKNIYLYEINYDYKRQWGTQWCIYLCKSCRVEVRYQVDISKLEINAHIFLQ